MLKNKIIFKRIRNICILVMAVAILVGAYTYVRRSRAENIIQIELEVSDKSEILEKQKIIVDATETEDGNYLLELPTSVNGIIVTKYYRTDGSEVAMNDENTDKTLTITETDVTNQPIQLQTDYDKKDVTTEDGQIITLYNKELMDVKDAEEDTNAENTEGVDNEAQANENQATETTGDTEEISNEPSTEETTNETTGTDENETTDETTQKQELDDTVIVTGYMPLESQVDINKIDVSTMNVQLPNDTQTIQDAYEVSIYQTIRRTYDSNGNMTAQEIVMPEILLPEEETMVNEAGVNAIEGDTTQDVTEENQTGENITDNSATENMAIENETDTATNTMSIENITSENAKENENVESITESTTPDSTIITTIILKDGTRIEEETIEYDPSIYNEQLTIKTKFEQTDTIATIYNLTGDNQATEIATISNNEYIQFNSDKTESTLKYIIATEPKPVEENVTNDMESMALNTNGIMTLSEDDGIMLTAETGTTDWVSASTIFDSAATDSNKLHIGDFVNYDAGTWTSSEISNIKVGPISSLVTANGSTSRPSTGFQFGGFAAGSSRNGNATPSTFTVSGVTYGDYVKDASTGNALTGWRVFDVEGDTVTLISAGNPEDYYHPASTYAYASQYILIGDVNNSATTPVLSSYQKRDWSDYIQDNQKATTANALSKSRLDTWFSKYISSGANTYTKSIYQQIYSSPYTRYQNMIDNFSWFWVSSPYNERSLYYANAQYRNINYYSNYAFGVRVLVTLSSDAKFSATRTGTKTVTGGNTTSYGGNQTYNVWALQRSQPQWTKLSSSENIENNTVSVTVGGAGSVSEYSNTTTSTLTESDIKVFIDGTEVTTGITKNLSTGSVWTTTLGSNTATGVQYTITLTGDAIRSASNIKIQLAAGTLKDQYGTQSDETEISVFSTLKSTNSETVATSGFLGNTSIQRQNIDNVTFVDSIPDGLLDGLSDTNTDSQDGLVRSYDASNNTGSGHSNSTTTWKDLSGNQDATINGATWGEDYLSLDGVDDWVGLGNIDFTDQVTLDATITAKSISAGERIILCNFDQGGCGLTLESGVPRFQVYIDGVGYVYVEASETITVGEKTRITGTYDGTTISLYINGELVSQTVQSGAIGAPTKNTIMAIGVNPSGSSATSRSGYADINVYSASAYDEAIQTKAWDVSEAQDGSIMAWAEENGNGTYKVYIGSNDTIYANPDSSYLFANIGYSSDCTATETITNLNLLNTSKVTNMRRMFNYTGYETMTSLDLGNNFDTSKVTDMSSMFSYTGYKSMATLDLGNYFDTSNVRDMEYMFIHTGYTAMTSLDLGDKFDTSNVTDMSYMFRNTGYTAMISMNLGDQFDTSNVTNMEHMFDSAGRTAMTSLELGDKFDTSKVTNMSSMFYRTGNNAMTSLDLGPAFTKIAELRAQVFGSTGTSGLVIHAPEAIYQNRKNFKLNTNSSTTVNIITGTINPKYRTEWIKQSVQVSTSSKNVQISLRGTTNTEVSGSEYASNVTSSLTVSNIKIFMDDTEVTSYITKSLGSATRTYNSSTGAYDVLHTLTLSNLEEAAIRIGKDYKEWSGNIRIEIPQGTLTDTYGNKNMELASDGSRDDNNIEDATTDRNTTNTLFADFIKPDFIYNFSSTDIDHEAKTLTVDFSVTDKYFNRSTISSNASNIVVRMADTNTVPENLTTSLRKIQDITETRNGSSVKVGEEYRLVISGFEQASVDNGKYKEYSGPVSIAFPANMVMDKSGNGNNSKTITVGIDEPDGTGDEEIVDFIRPEIEEISSSIDLEAKTATVKFQVTDKYVINSNPLETGDVQILVNGSPVTVNGGTGVLAALGRTNLTEQRVENGVTSTVQYGWEYNLEIRNLDTNVNQIKVRIPEGAITDTSGNGNEQTDFILLNTLKQIASGERAPEGQFLGNTSIQRQNINNITFMDYIPEDVYDDLTDTYVDSTAWDVSAVGDNSIIAWYEPSANGTVKVYIGSNDEMFGNVDSSYLFAYIGYSSNCTATETITNIGLLNVSNVTNMSSMFRSTGYAAMTSLELGDKFDTSNVTNMSSMFNSTGYAAMTSLELGDKFDTSSVTDMSYMFQHTGRMAMTSLDLGDKFDTSNVINMSYMFYYTGYETMSSLNLGDNFDTSNVTTMDSMFMGTGYTTMTSLDLGEKFDTSSVTDMSYMFNETGYTTMTSLDLGDKFDTSSVTDMSYMFQHTGRMAMTSLDLGDKFNTSKAIDMRGMFYFTGINAMTSLDLGPAFTHIAENNTGMFRSGKSGEIVIQATEAIYQNATNFKLSTDSTTMLGFTRGTINPKYRTEWIKETVEVDETDVNNPEINITLRGTTNTEVAADEYISDVTSSLTTNDIKIFVDDTDVTNIVTKTLGTATQTTNTRTGANDVSQVLTLSNFIEATRQTGKLYKEWSGNIRVEIPQGTLVDTTYGNKNMGLADDGTREDSKIEDETKVEQNTPNGMFVDYIKPEFTYEYSSTDINYDEKTLTVEFSVTDKYFNSTTGLTNANGITVKMLDTNVVPENITKTLTKVEDINETRNGEEVKIGETYRLVVSGFEQASIENGKYKEYSGPVSIAFPAGIVSDKSGNTNTAKTITVGIDEPDQTGDAEIVDVVDPMWRMGRFHMNKLTGEVTVDLYGTDKYYESHTFNKNKIKVIIDGEEITSTTNVIKQLSAPTVLTETRDGVTVQYGVMYTLRLRNFIETDSEFETSGRIYREYSGNVELQIDAGTLVDASGNENEQTTIKLGKVDVINPEIRKVSSNVDEENQKETIVFDVIDKDLATVGITTTDTSKIHVYVDDEEATTITKTITDVQDLTATIDGNSRVVGKRYTLELSNIVQPRTTTIDYDREYADWSGNISITIDEGTATDKSGNANEETTIEGDFVDFIKPEVIYQYAETDIDSDGKSYTMVFDIVDKYYTSGTLTLEDLTILIDGEEPDWAEVNKALQVEDRINMVNGESKVIGKRFTLTLSNLEQLQIKEGDNYLDYSGVVTVAIPADKIMDTTGHGNDATTLTSGISLPGGTGAEEVVDVVDPLVEKITSNVDVANKTATMTFKATDKYFENSTLTNENIQIVVNGSEDITGITKQLTSTPLNEQRVVNGASSTVQYGVQYELTLSGIDTNVNQIKVRIPEGLVTDQSGNGNKETDLILFNTLRNTSTEKNETSPFLGNTSIQRQNVDNVTFVDNIPEDVYDVSTNTFVDSTAWDVSAVGDNSIIAWHEPSTNGTIKVYIGSNHQIFGNVDSSYLFSYIGYSSDCTATETVTNINLLNTSNVTDMHSMFSYTGYKAMTSLDLGEKFDTSNVITMSSMFNGTGYTAMTSFDLGDKFDTSKVTNMYMMFYATGYKAMTSFDLGDKFDTSKVTNMQMMFFSTGYTAMTKLELGDKFDTSNVTYMSRMFVETGYKAMTTLNLGDKFDTSNVEYMETMFATTGYTAMTSLDLGDKFDTSNATNMSQMFYQTGYTAMTNLDLGPAFTNIASTNTNMFSNTGKSGEIVIQAPEAIYQNSTNFKLNTDSSTTISFTRGTINPKYRTEWLKEGVQVDEADVNNPNLNITLRGTTNTEVDPTEYISDVTSSLVPEDIKVFIDNTEITDVVTKTVGTATQTANTRTGAQDVLQTVTLTNFEEVTRRTGKSYKEWSGNIRVEVAQGTLSDTVGPADAEGNRTTYGNKNMEVASTETQTGATTGAGAVTEIGARIDNIIEDETKVEQNTTNAMFADFIKPEFTYTYSSTDINYDEKTLTVEFSVTDKYFNTSDVLNNQDNITVKMLEEDVVPENITKTLTKVEDITEMRDEQEVKIGETYRLVVSGFEQASIAEDGNYKEYSGPVSIVFPAGMSSDKSGNANDQKNITIGINEPDGTGNAEIVDVVTPIWEARNVNIDKENNKVTVDLYGTDKYYANNTLDVNKIKVIIDGEEVTSTTNVTKQLSVPTALTETRDGANVQYGVKYTLTLSNWKESDTVFQASEKEYREYSGNTEIQIEAGTLVDESGNENIQTTLNLGMIDIIDPEVYQISSTKDDTAKTDTIVFEVVDKYFASAQISATDTSKLTVYVDNEEAIGVTTTITNEEDMTATVNGTSRVIGKRYTLVISNFEQPRTTIDYDREYSDWSGDVTVKIDAGTIVDESGNSNQNQE